jgi:hypothetical protein
MASALRKHAALAAAVAAAFVMLAVAVAQPEAHAPSQSKSPSRKKPTAAPASKPAPAPKVERPVPFKAGETLAYDISWSTFMTAATATVRVEEKRPSYNSLAYYIVAEGQPNALVAALYKLYYKADTLLDAYTLLPQRGSLYSREAGRQHLRATRFLQDTHTAQYEVQSGPSLTTDSRQDLQVPPATQDALSAVYALRAAVGEGGDLKPGGSIIMPVSLNGTTYRVRVVTGNKEPVTCGLGTLTAWKLMPSLLDQQGEPEAQNMAVWISDDSRHLPLLMQADFAVGTFKLTLRNASGPGS